LYVRKGALSVAQFGRDGLIGPGQYTLLNLDKPYLFSHADRMEMICLKAPAHLLRLRDARLEAQCALVRPAHSGVARLAAHHINGLCGDDLSGMDELLPSLSRTAVDLLSLLFDSAEHSSLPDESAVQSALRRRACAYLAANFAAPDLDPVAVAQALGISVRYLHRCFQPMGTSVMRHLTGLRLENCRRELLDPFLKRHPVSEIAFRNGFRNVSHFSDAFKARFGVTARDVKAGVAPFQARFHHPVW
jgi:AraC-like DNA-binding protein